ncbi:MAG: hypothetical protein IH886_02505 [Nitrospinae bacterium]|nr:hypothetical protein [Nitrospinota bacterium]
MAETKNPRIIIRSLIAPDPDYRELQREISEMRGDICTLEGKVKRLSRSLLNTMQTVAHFYARERGRDGSFLRPDFKNLISIEEDLVHPEQNWNVEDRYENEKFFADQGE